MFDDVDLTIDVVAMACVWCTAGSDWMRFSNRNLPMAPRNYLGGSVDRNAIDLIGEVYSDQSLMVSDLQASALEGPAHDIMMVSALIGPHHQNMPGCVY